MHDYYKQIDQTKDRIINSMYLVIALLFIPLIGIAVYRDRAVGITPISWTLICILGVFLGIYVLRQLITQQVKIVVMIFGLLVSSITGLMSYALLGNGLIVLLVASVLATLVWGFKPSLYVYAASLVIILFMGFLTINRQITFLFDPTVYFFSATAWGFAFIVYCIITLMLMLSINAIADRFKESIEKISDSENRYKALYENIDEIIFSVTIDGVLLTCNTPMERALAVARVDLIGRHFTDLFKGEQSKRLWKARFEQVIQAKSKVSFQFTFDDSSKGESILDVRLIPIMDKDGKLIQILGTSADLTELIKTRDKIEKLLIIEKDRLEELVEQKTIELKQTMEELMDRERHASLGTLVAGVAHEINTPLGVAVTAASFLADENEKAYQKLNSEQFSKQDLLSYMSSMDESAEIVNTNLARAAELIKSFKEISINQSIESMDAFEVYDYIQSIILTLKHEYKNTNHHFEIKCPETLVINSYAGVFSQILTNFIMNSLIHGLKNTPEGLIRIEVMEGESAYELLYSDNGQGIEESNIKYIFDPFFTTNRTHGGSGLGLHIVYNLVTGKLKGTIKCESHYGAGTTFRIHIPKV